LDKKLADGKKLPRWKPQSRCSVNASFSAKHASSVPLVLSAETGCVAANFCIAFNDWFATVTLADDGVPDVASEPWCNLFGDSEHQCAFDEGGLASQG
jgi:hypothetical protein